ncbi:recombinase family protein [Haematospirillum jordaniae]|uniref:Recombinase domain-containing protein n=1 Tax=Haematospirillum jordaniae TaxID=1549855 RepID=A0A143DG51_9PROT|nr:recombinase family protein [Haematospirillum jordaniae]AMW35754.1 hypothetical protein AY555_10250 [Haematospirillum jordaniae]AMW35948.1 hypothetical protein AY555_11365 [Haematospirillum jordaniae]NKD58154.1 recombinase family protein [Haematospirillum jordaniae]NKD60264.1 recombinase family protein [Haematospirillum jordaniae]NKD68203.1 recombinase family protein [Haematospirillum jordaniae]
MLVAIYARHSTDKQDTSSADQVARCIQFCADRGWTVSHIFADEALSGATMSHRENAKALVAAALAGEFEKVLSEDLSRLSRSQSDIAALYEKLRFMGIDIETIADGTINELHIGLKGTMNALYLRDLADKTRRGLRAITLRGKIPGGLCYGYRTKHRLDEKGELVRGEREIHPGEAEVIRRIYSEYHDGAILSEICEGLNDDGIASPRGGTWSISALVGTASRQTGVLRHTLYKGWITWNRQEYRVNPETGKRNCVVRPQSEWLRIPVPELAIVDEDLFDAVQRMIEDRSSMRHIRAADAKARSRERAMERQRKARSLQMKTGQTGSWFFTRRLRCAETGHPLTAAPPGYYGSRRTALWMIPRETIIVQGLEALNTVDLDTIRTFQETLSPDRQRHESAIERLQQQIDQATDEVKALLSDLGNRTNRPVIRSFLDDKEKQITNARLQLYTHQRELDKLIFRTDLANESLNRWKRLLARLKHDPSDGLSTVLVRTCINRLLVHVERNADDEPVRLWCTADINVPELLKLNTAIMPWDLIPEPWSRAATVELKDIPKPAKAKAKQKKKTV